MQSFNNSYHGVQQQGPKTGNATYNNSGNFVQQGNGNKMTTTTGGKNQRRFVNQHGNDNEMTMAHTNPSNNVQQEEGKQIFINTHPSNTVQQGNGLVTHYNST